MATKIGVAHSNRTNSKAAAIESATNALANAGITHADFALIFCSGKHNPHEFLSTVQSVLGNIPLVGGTSIGIMTKDFIAYEGYEVGITVFSSDTLTFKVFA